VTGTYLRDLLYFDVEKAASIFSQLQGGLPRETQETSEQGRERKKGIGLTLGPLRPELAGTSSEKTSVIETRVLHHDLLVQIEDALFEIGAALELTAEDKAADRHDGEPERVQRAPFEFVRTGAILGDSAERRHGPRRKKTG
jgi:hypothetical protein